MEYWKWAFDQAWERSQLYSTKKAVPAVMIALVSLWLGFQPWRQVIVSILFGVGSYIVLWLGEFVFRLLVQGPVVRDKEHAAEIELLKGELDGSSLPALRGCASKFDVGMYGHGYADGKWGASAKIKFELEVHNHNDAPTNIAYVAISGTEIDPTFMFANSRCLDAPQELRRGIRHIVHVEAEASMRRDPPPIEGQWPGEITISLERLIVIIVDGFGENHLMLVGANETMTF